MTSPVDVLMITILALMAVGAGIGVLAILIEWWDRKRRRRPHERGKGDCKATGGIQAFRFG